MRPELPEALDAVIARAMAKAPDERFATCREMIEAARAALGGAVGGRRRRDGAARGIRSPRRARASRRTCPCSRRRSSAATTSSTAVDRAACEQPDRAARHADRPRRHRQDAPRARGRDERCADEFDETYFVDLAPVQDPQLVGSAIADVLGVREAPDRPLAETIAERLGDRPTLLVLDNFEQVLPGGAAGRRAARAPRRA